MYSALLAALVQASVQPTLAQPPSIKIIGPSDIRPALPPAMLQARLIPCLDRAGEGVIGEKVIGEKVIGEKVIGEKSQEVIGEKIIGEKIIGEKSHEVIGEKGYQQAKAATLVGSWKAGGAASFRHKIEARPGPVGISLVACSASGTQQILTVKAAGMAVGRSLSVTTAGGKTSGVVQVPRPAKGQTGSLAVDIKVEGGSGAPTADGAYRLIVTQD